jgi:hypothetical protein
LSFFDWETIKMQWHESRRPLRFFTSLLRFSAAKVRKMLQKWLRIGLIEENRYKSDNDSRRETKKG